MPAVAPGKNIFDTTIIPADATPNSYCYLLKGKKVALIINQTSKAGDSSMLDILLQRNINVVKIFVPEHGFRGKEDAGADIAGDVDSATGIPVISLYGAHKKPSVEDISGIDIMVYDLQDVGARFYTYISTLEYCMEACAENRKPFMVLDKPNPNGFYVDGPVLEKQNKSFVGMQAIPIVYGMTAGEYATMIAGENWFSSAGQTRLTVIKCSGYTHKKKYKLPVAPSPNLRTMAAVYAYPSLCLFEGTKVSVGRGTNMPFQQYGCPAFEGEYVFIFTPESSEGAKKPLFENSKCYGEVIGVTEDEVLRAIDNKLQLKWLLKGYVACPAKNGYFNSFFIKLSGTASLQEQIEKGATEKEIRKSWEKGLENFKKIRKKYLLYKDFE